MGPYLFALARNLVRGWGHPRPSPRACFSGSRARSRRLDGVSQVARKSSRLARKDKTLHIFDLICSRARGWVPTRGPIATLGWPPRSHTPSRSPPTAEACGMSCRGNLWQGSRAGYHNVPGWIAKLGNRPAGETAPSFKGWGSTIELTGAEGTIVSAFISKIIFGSCTLLPVIVISVVGAAWLFGRAGERIGLLVSRPRESAGGRKDERAKSKQVNR